MLVGFGSEELRTLPSSSKITPQGEPTGWKVQRGGMAAGEPSAAMVRYLGKKPANRCTSSGAHTVIRDL
jgi:hypothetical protein